MVYKSSGPLKRGSVLSIPSKIMEFEVNDILVRHISTDNNLASNRQWPCCSGHLTESLLIHLMEMWRRALDSRKFVALVFINVRKTFDSVSHATLVMKLWRDFGITGMLLDWLKSYLSERRQFTVLNGTKSDMLPVSIGIPKGSVLGSTLFMYLQMTCHHQSNQVCSTCLLTIL